MKLLFVYLIRTFVFVALLFAATNSFAQKKEKAKNYDSLVYRNGKPFNGSKKDDHQLVSYKNGKLHGVQTIYRPAGRDKLVGEVYTGGISRNTYYTNDMMDSVEYFDYYLIDTIEKDGYYSGHHYKGICKNGLPFKGYFLLEDSLSDRIVRMNFYKNGKVHHQFYKSPMVQMIECNRLKWLYRDDFEIPFYLDSFTTYKNGKPWTGMEFYRQDSAFIIEKYVREAKVNRIDYLSYRKFFPSKDWYSYRLDVTTLELNDYGYSLSCFDLDTIKATMQVVYDKGNPHKGSCLILVNDIKAWGEDFEFHELLEDDTVVNETRRSFFLHNLKVLVLERRNFAYYNSRHGYSHSLNRLRTDDILYHPNFENIQALPFLSTVKKWSKILVSVSRFKDTLYGIDIHKDKGKDTYNYTWYDEGTIRGSEKGIPAGELHKKTWRLGKFAH